MGILEQVTLRQKRKHMAPEAVSSHFGTRNGASPRMMLTQRDGKNPGLSDILEALDEAVSKVFLCLDFFSYLSYIFSLLCFFHHGYTSNIFLSVK